MENHPAIKVLVCPLNWGLGHATRCVPVIRMLRNKGFRVIIGADGLPLEFLRLEFPDLEYCRFPGFSPSYPRDGKMVLRMLASVPAFITGIIREHRLLKILAAELGISLVISDNRYGLWHRKIKSILIIHQIMIKTPQRLRVMEPLLYLINRLMISRFDECWIPDLPGDINLSGDLSHKYPLPRNANFIGPLSRFEPAGGQKKTGDFVLALISGPEPQRSTFEDILTKQLADSDIPVIILTGKPGSSEKAHTIGHVTLIPHLPTSEFQDLLHSASTVICRSGYTTLMDLATVGARALFIPTPGQTEQEYLAKYHEQKGHFAYMKQNNLNLYSGLDRMPAYKGVIIMSRENLLAARNESLAKQFGMPS